MDVRVTPTHRIEAAHQQLGEAAQAKADLLAVILTLEDQVADLTEQVDQLILRLPDELRPEEVHGEAPPLP